MALPLVHPTWTINSLSKTPLMRPAPPGWRKCLLCSPSESRSSPLIRQKLAHNQNDCPAQNTVTIISAEVTSQNIAGRLASAPTATSRTTTLMSVGTTRPLPATRETIRHRHWDSPWWDNSRQHIWTRGNYTNVPFSHNSLKVSLEHTEYEARMDYLWRHQSYFLHCTAESACCITQKIQAES